MVEWGVSVKKMLMAGLAGLLLSACVTTQEMPLAPNMVRLDTEAGGLLFVGQAVPQTMRRAAQATIARGYTHFRLEQASLQQGSQVAGATINRFGPGAYSVTPINRRTASAGATVIMFHANDPGARGAFEAAAVLRQYGS